MRKLNINLPKYRLFLQFRLIKRRKPLVDEAFIPSASLINKKYRKGTAVGKFVRHIFDHKRVGRVLGAGLSLIVIAGSFFPPYSNVQAQGETDTVIIESETTLKTQKSIQIPVGEIKITQGFSFFHPGVDLDGLTGDPIRPIKPGHVIAVSYSKFSYGEEIIIDHGNGLTSLYAHLSQINVKAGDEVSMDTIIGKMGSTGHSTGDHLHLEVHKNGRAINPLSILPR